MAFEDKKMNKIRDNLILSSIHQSKGLEFEIVFFLFLDRDIIPYKKTEDVIEEKRLFYVGITRPKKFLFLVNSSEEHSPFLDKIDLNLNE
jgi:DNA helicase-2/ATP-dependent DNA helicase PcrA